jgi:multidrug efflux pump
VLPVDVQPADVVFGQTIIVTKGLEERNRLRGQFQAYLDEAMPGTDAFVRVLDIRPPPPGAVPVEQLTPAGAAFNAKLPPGYRVVIGGAMEESQKSQAPIPAVTPLMLFIMATILMIQLQSFQRLVLVFAVAALVPSGAPPGFVAILGVLALIGILIRNSVILIVQIEHLRAEGHPPWETVREVFWGPMAYAMMGRIIVGTVLTLLFLPALYVAWFRIPAPKPGDGAQGPDATGAHTG